jgi:hypothetical protein
VRTKNEGIQHTKARLGESLKKIWKSKVMHSQYIVSIDKQLISETDTSLSLSTGDLKAENVSQITAAQDRALQKNIMQNVLQIETDNKCRLCQKFYEKIEHFIPACPILSKEKYVKRRDRVYVQLYMQGNMGKITK